MPELPDITVYLEALAERIGGRTLENVRITNPFLLRTFDPPVEEAFGKRVGEMRRLGKRIAIGLQDDLWLVLHLMIAGRLHWLVRGCSIPPRRGLAALDFTNGSVLLTEAGTQRRAGLWVVRGNAELVQLDPGGIDVFAADLHLFTAVLTGSNHTLKRALTDPKLFSGIGNAYSDEIAHRARLSPVKLTQKLSSEEIERLFHATRETLAEWTDRIRRDAGDQFPERVTAFRRGMAVHGRYGKPCPVCDTIVQRIRYAENETNYCPRCQTGGKLLADRSLSRLLKGDWPKTIDEWENQ